MAVQITTNSRGQLIAWRVLNGVCVGKNVIPPLIFHQSRMLMSLGYRHHFFPSACLSRINCQEGQRRIHHRHSTACDRLRYPDNVFHRLRHQFHEWPDGVIQDRLGDPVRPHNPFAHRDTIPPAIASMVGKGRAHQGSHLHPCQGPGQWQRG